MSHEALKSYFEESEYEKASQRANIEGLAEKMEQIKNDPDYRLNQLEEKIDKTPDTFEARFNAFQEAVKIAEKNIVQPSEDIIQSAADTLHIKKAALSNGLKQDLSQATGWKESIALWGLDLTNSTNNQPGIFNTIKKVIGGIILSMFGGDIYTKYQNDLTLLENGSVEEKTKENIEASIENKNNAYNSLGRIMVTSMGGEEFNTEDNPSFVLESIEEQDITYHQLKKLSYKNLKNKTKVSEDQFDKMKKAWLSNSMAVICDSMLSPHNLSVLSENPKINKVIQKIGIGSIKDVYWEELSTSQITQLLGVALAKSSTAILKNMGGIGADILSQIYGLTQNNSFNSITENTQDEIAQFEAEVMPKELFGKLISKGKLNNAGSVDFNYAEIEKELGDINKKDAIYVKRIISFRNFAEQNILNNNSYLLGQKELMNKKLTFNNIVQLYMLFEGKGTAEELKVNNMKSCMVYLWIGRVLEQGSDQILKSTGTTYWSRLIKEIGNKEKSKVSSDDKLLLQVITKKIGDEAIVDPLIKGLQRGLDLGMDNKESVATISLIALMWHKFGPMKRLSIFKKVIAVSGTYGALLFAELNISDQELIRSRLDPQEQKQLERGFSI